MRAYICNGPDGHYPIHLVLYFRYAVHRWAGSYLRSSDRVDALRLSLPEVMRSACRLLRCVLCCLLYVCGNFVRAEILRLHSALSSWYVVLPGAAVHHGVFSMAMTQ